MKKEMTQICLSKATRERIREFGKKGQTYEKILIALLKAAGGKNAKKD